MIEIPNEWPQYIFYAVRNRQKLVETRRFIFDVLEETRHIEIKRFMNVKVVIYGLGEYKTTQTFTGVPIDAFENEPGCWVATWEYQGQSFMVTCHNIEVTQPVFEGC